MTAEIPQEAVERAIAFMHYMARKPIDERFLGYEAEMARDILRLIPEPVDPDLIEARNVAGDAMAAAVRANFCKSYSTGAINAVRTGNDDDNIYVIAALAGIKRGREIALKARAVGEGS